MGSAYVALYKYRYMDAVHIHSMTSVYRIRKMHSVDSFRYRMQ